MGQIGPAEMWTIEMHLTIIPRCFQAFSHLPIPPECYAGARTQKFSTSWQPPPPLPLQLPTSCQQDIAMVWREAGIYVPLLNLSACPSRYVPARQALCKALLLHSNLQEK